MVLLGVGIWLVGLFFVGILEFLELDGNLHIYLSVRFDNANVCRTVLTVRESSTRVLGVVPKGHCGISYSRNCDGYHCESGAQIQPEALEAKKVQKVQRLATTPRHLTKYLPKVD